MKRILAFVLCLALCASLSAAAFAAEEASSGGSRRRGQVYSGYIGPRTALAEEASEEASEEPEPESGSAMDAMEVVEIGGEEYIRLDDLILGLLLGGL